VVAFWPWGLQTPPRTFSAVSCGDGTVLSVLTEVHLRLDRGAVEALLQKDPSKLCAAAQTLVRRLKRDAHMAQMQKEQQEANAAA